MSAAVPSSMELFVDEKHVLGRGMYGTVYSGKLWSRKVAAKRCLSSSNLRTEARLLKLCSHTNVVETYGVRTFKGQPYLVMELAEAGDLSKHLGQDVFSTKAKQQLVQQICRGLDHIHAKFIVHRDIQDQNVFFKSLTPLHVVIGDFGQARFADKCKSLPNDHDVVFDSIYSFKSDVYLLALVTIQIFRDDALASRLGLAERTGEEGLEVETFTEARWRDTIMNSFNCNPDVRPTAAQFGNAFS